MTIDVSVPEGGVLSGAFCFLSDNVCVDDAAHQQEQRFNGTRNHGTNFQSIGTYIEVNFNISLTGGEETTSTDWRKKKGYGIIIF